VIEIDCQTDFVEPTAPKENQDAAPSPSKVDTGVQVTEIIKP